MRYANVDRLTVRLAVGITLSVVLVMSAGFYVLSKHYHDDLIEDRRKSADLQNKLIRAALEHQMLKKDRTLIEKIVEEVASRDEIEGMLLLDHNGKVRYSSDPTLLGQSFPQSSPSCQVCHKYPPGERTTSAILELERGDVLRSVQAIRNQPACYSCHSPSVEVNGMLVLDTSMASLRQDLARNIRWMAVGTAALAIVLLSGIGLVLRNLVLKRLSALASAARLIGAGELRHRVKVEGNDQITLLGVEFNQMADSLTKVLADVRREQARVENIMNGVGDDLFVLDRDLRVVGANVAFLRRPDLEGESVLGRSCREVADRQSLPCAEAGLCLGLKCFSTGEPQRGTFIHSTPEGERVWDVHTSPILDEDGGLTQVVEVWRDSTDRMREEMRLAEFERLTSLGVLASGFSHEMNTPLSSMLISTNRILEELGREGSTGVAASRADLEEYAEIVRAEILRCTKITRQFLHFSRGHEVSIELVDVQRVVEAVVPLVLPTARQNGVSVEVEPLPPMPTIKANYTVVQQVLLNLLINAVQSCADGDRVSVRCEANASVRIITEDNGCGIPEKELGRIFEPFYSRRPSGTGLGLFLSLSMVRKFGGDIKADSEPGVGSRFEIVFPMPEEEAP